ncbi:Rare lipoprotein A [uncultured Caudovirales phage]|uniref:Rare lipoprotein A n=1 Tax=uncultured Caudovirales phage TaxID=2100421 RepID=A0A6J5KYE0_9CAUD|nr:Rare lipoprotein A [uncultured Caudovirales phage]
MLKYKSIIILCALLVINANVQAKQIIHKLHGTASWYSYQKGNRSHKTASGEIFSPHKLTAAHKTLPFGTKVLVTNLDNRQSVLVTITDRGPFIKGRVVDLSKAAALKIGIKGIQKVSMQIVS